MAFKRNIENILKEWKQKNGHNPIVIKGVRQCGKTFSVKAFAEKNYKHVVYLDFHEHKEYKAFFAGALDVDTLLMNIAAGMPDSVFEKGQTCLIFDEIQDCPAARASLKFWKHDGRFDVICTGSLLGVNGYKTKEEQEEEERTSIPVGYEDIVNMYPMDFEEWLWANGIRPMHIDYLKQCLETETLVNEALHERMRQLLLQYIIVGGMPKAVATFLETKHVGEVAKVQRAIIDDYKSDMLKYALLADKPRIRECFESIPRQLARENKKFSYNIVRANGRGRDYNGCLQWIEDAGIIRRCHNLEITELPLDGNSINDAFKVYMADTGLFVSMLEDGTASSILQGDLYTYKGAIFENLLADIFGKMGRKLYYFHKDSGLELDFVIRYKSKCTPIECKAENGNAKSLRTVLNNQEKYHVDQAIKIGNYNIFRNGNVLNIPHYLAFLLREV